MIHLLKNIKYLIKNRIFWSVSLLLLLVFFAALLLTFYLKAVPNFIDYDRLQSGLLSEAQKTSITLTTELNKFLVSITTLMFGVIVYLTHNNNKQWFVYAFLSILSIFLVGNYFLSYLIYSHLTSDLAQNALALKPGGSEVLHYLETSLYVAIISFISIVLVYIFTDIFKGNRTNPTRH